MKSLLLMLIILWGAESWSHGGKDHSKPDVKKSTSHHDSLMNKSSSEFIKAEINVNYLNNVKPIFKRSCFDCHGSPTNYPWYYKISGIKQLIDRDIEMAKKHLDFTSDFPFKSHDTPLNDLSAILKSIKHKAMPPLRYRLMHSNTGLSEKEIIIIKGWIEDSTKKLKNK